MKKVVFSNSGKTGMQALLFLSVLCFSFGAGSVRPGYASTPLNGDQNDACGQLLTEAEARFKAALGSDGSVPASPEMKAAATEYIRVSKLCYEEIEAQNSAGSLQGETPLFIDEGGVRLGDESSAEFVLTGTKWGSSTQGTAGGTVTYSFMGNGISFTSENNGYGNSVAISSLPGFQACYVTEIQNAFAAWEAVANIQFVQVTDNGAAFNGAGAAGDIRIAAHTFDGGSGTLAHAYFPPPNGNSAAGDLHFDRAENWSCNSSGIDIGIVALHEIGHSLGLNHENSGATAVMDPFYNSSLPGLLSDDINGARAIYGPASLGSPPANDNFAGAKTVGAVPYLDPLDTTGAAILSDSPLDPVTCGGQQLNRGTKNVWYKFTSPTPRSVTFDTLGSDYDTYLAIWTGSDVNSLSLVTCNDDDPSSIQSQVSITAQANVTYRIEVAQYNGVFGGSTSPSTGGNLLFHATSFSDVPGNYWAWQHVEGFYDERITTGCANPPLQYCPEREVTRAEMSVFLLRAMFGAAFVPNPAQTGIFQDVPVAGKEWMQPWIEEFYEQGITTGCATAPLRFCPERSVTRAEMAVFILRAKYGASHVPNPVQTNIFSDVPVPGKEWMKPWIEEFYEEGITTGCANPPLQYCPERNVTRAEMAVFINRAFGFTPLP